MTHKGKEKRGQGWRRALVFLMTLVLICGLAAPVYAEQTDGELTVASEQTNQEPVTPVAEGEKSGEESNQTVLLTEDTPVTDNAGAEQDVQTGSAETDTTGGETHQADAAGNNDTETGTDENNVTDENNNTETGTDENNVTDENNDTEGGTAGTGTPEGNTPESDPVTEGEVTEGENTEKSLYDRLMAAESCNAMLTLIQENEADFNAMTPTVAEKEQLSNKVTELPYDESTDAVIEKIAGLTTKEEPQSGKNSDPVDGDTATTPSLGDMISDALGLDFGADALANYSESVEVGESKTLSGNGYWSSNHNWTSDKPEFATVDGNGYYATVTGVSEGTATITHTYKISRKTYTDTWTVTVTGQAQTGNEGAQVYYLKTPTSDPDSNATNQWGENVGTARVNTSGATWINDKNIIGGLDPYIISWPDNSTEKTWVMPKEQYADHYQAIFDAYNAELEKDLGVSITFDDIEEITLIPYKISKNNSTSPDKHVDCKISVKCKNVFVARFNVEFPGDNRYTNVLAKNYKTTDKIAEYYDADRVPEEMEYEGITYVFNGWYDEDGNEVTQWPHAPTDGERADGTVNFYAHYTPKPASLTIKKAFDGLAEGAEKPRTISVAVTGGDSFNKTVELTAANGYTYELTNLDPRVEYTVEENEDSAQITNYTLTKVTYADSKTITPSQDGTSKVTITNTYTPLTTTLTVTKIVDGGLGDKTKQFNFTVTVKNGTENAQFTFNNEEKSGICEFVLSHESVANLTVPIGSTVTVTEEDYGEGKGGYTTTVAGVVTRNGEQWTAAAPAEGAQNTITFTNFKDASPDTGVLLDSLPYILILAAVALAVVLMLVLKRRRADD